VRLLFRGTDQAFIALLHPFQISQKRLRLGHVVLQLLGILAKQHAQCAGAQPQDVLRYIAKGIEAWHPVAVDLAGALMHAAHLQQREAAKGEYQ